MEDYDGRHSQNQGLIPLLQFKARPLELNSQSVMSNSNRPADQVRLLTTYSVHGKTPSPGSLSNWDHRHLAAMKLHGVAPWIYAFTRNRAELGLPEQLGSELRNEYYKSLLQSISHESCIRRLTACFSREKISMVLLKGTYLGLFVYENPALRPMCDVDILIQEGDLGRAQELLKELGFLIAIDVPQEFEPHSYPSRPYIRPAAAAEVLDLHTALWGMDHYCLSAKTVWRNSLEANVLGGLSRILTTEMNFIQIAVHILGHPPRLRDSLDLMMILTRLKPDWNTIMDLARTLGVLRPLYWVVADLDRHWECPVPTTIMDSLRSYRASAIEDLVIKSRFRYFWRIVSRVMSQQGLRNKVKFLRLRILPSPEYREAVLGTRNPARYLSSKLRYFLGLYKKG